MKLTLSLDVLLLLLLVPAHVLLNRWGGYLLVLLLLLYVYLPGLLLLSLPFRQAITPLLGFYDQRLLYLLAYVVVLLLPLLAQRPERKLSLLAAVGLNPLLLDPIAIGMNAEVIAGSLRPDLKDRVRTEVIGCAVLVNPAIGKG